MPPSILPPLAPSSANLNYGGDTAGLIWGYRLGADGPPREVDSAQAAQWLAEEGPAAEPGAFLWLHFNLSHAQAVRCRHRQHDIAAFFGRAGCMGGSAVKMSV